MRDEGNEKELIARFLRHCSLEVTPVGAKKIGNFANVLHAGTKVYITFLADSDFGDTVRTAIRLRREGMNPVPHIAARSIPSRSYLEQILKALQAEASVEEVLVIAGSINKPVGEFDSSMPLLETGLLQKYGISRIGVAGHPEGCPDISPEELKKVLLQKNAYARRHAIEMHITTQFCFAATPVIEWDRKIRQEGNELPIHIGIPGLATIKTLLGHAKACGVGPSMRVLTRQSGNMARLMTTRMPDRLVRELAVYTANNTDSGIKQCHLYPFGGLEKSVAWLQAIQDGDFELDQKNGFKLLRDLARL